ncbi:MAG: winged helix-turn-helix domain-containing protein [Oscillospiraceae bacterium]|nr:winged helix-turn-helix domain-containing protein [Oscillospiraceae bacterium]
MESTNAEFFAANAAGGDYLFHIYTLGRFEIYSKGVRITETSKRSIRVWNLFKYILSHRNKMLSVGELIDVLWGEDGCENPEKALQNLIYRLRHYLSVNVKADDLILFNQGCYKWNEKFPVWVDCDSMSDYIDRGKELMKTSPYNARQCFEKAIELYNGDFLGDIIYDIWVLPIRTKYKKIYSDCVALFLELLDGAGDYEAVVRVCNEFFCHEFLDEKNNLFFLKALVSLGRKQEAQKHYEMMAEMMYRELGVNPSYSFADVLKQTKEISAKTENANIDLAFVNSILWKDERTQGAFQCDKDTFLAISKIMLRNLERSGLSIMMVLATFDEDGSPDGQMVEEGGHMANVIEETRKRFVQAFRRGDAVCHWNPKQILIMLTNLTFEDAETAMKRINIKIQDEILKGRYGIGYKIIPLEHEII